MAPLPGTGGGGREGWNWFGGAAVLNAEGDVPGVGDFRAEADRSRAWSCEEEPRFGCRADMDLSNPCRPFACPEAFEACELGEEGKDLPGPWDGGGGGPGAFRKGGGDAYTLLVGGDGATRCTQEHGPKDVSSAAEVQDEVTLGDCHTHRLHQVSVIRGRVHLRMVIVVLALDRASKLLPDVVVLRTGPDGFLLRRVLVEGDDVDDGLGMRELLLL